MMGLLVVYVAINASISGWTSGIPTKRSTPYFRFFAGMLFPFLAFLFMYNTARSEKQIKWALIALTLFGFYDLWIAYCQASTLLGGPNLRWLIWPGYINADIQGMIHFDRARGPFVGAGPQSIFLVTLFYVDLFLIRRVRGPYRWILLLQALAVLPALVFAGIRAGYVAFAVCGVVWCVWGLKGRFGWSKLAIATLVLTLAVLMRWADVSGTERLKGGVAQRKPVIYRVLLVHQTARMVADRPFFGVGFGHFLDAEAKLKYDPGSIALYGTGTVVPHNVLLALLAETGIVGMAIYLGLIWVVLRESLRVYRKIPPSAEGYLSRAFVVLFWVMLANYFAAGMFSDVLGDVFSNALLWVLGGLVIGFGRLGRSDLDQATRVPAPAGPGSGGQ